MKFDRDKLAKIAIVTTTALALLPSNAKAGEPPPPWAALYPPPDGYHWRFLPCRQGGLPNVPSTNDSDCIARQLARNTQEDIPARGEDRFENRRYLVPHK